MINTDVFASIITQILEKVRYILPENGSWLARAIFRYTCGQPAKNVLPKSIFAMELGQIRDFFHQDG